MWRCFDPTPKKSDFKHLIPQVSLKELNTARNEWQKRSEKFNFAKEDSNNDIEFNKVLWSALKPGIPFPGPRRSAFLTIKKEEEDD